MTRELKFRAWIPNMNKIVYIGDKKNDTALWLAENYFEVIDHFTGDPHSIGATGDDIILMQFTGLKDKNGVDIYEGDVVKFDRGDGEYVASRVRYEGGAFYPICEEPSINFEIIGNIHEKKDYFDVDKV